MNELETLESIIADKPERATHIEEKTNLFIKVLQNTKCKLFDEWFIFEDGEWIIADGYNILLMRSLADIEKQIDQLKEIDSLREQLAEMTSAFNSMDSQNRNIVWDNVCLNEQLASAPKWISVDEYLPRSANGTWSKRVIGLCDIGLVYSLSYFNSDLEVGGCWQRSNSFVENASKKIVAWMENPHFELLEGKG